MYDNRVMPAQQDLDVRRQIENQVETIETTVEEGIELGLGEWNKKLETGLIERVLRRNDYNAVATAAQLQTSRRKVKALFSSLTTKRSGSEFVEMSSAGARHEAPGSTMRQASLSPELIAHAVETFGSDEAARAWLSSDCGALNNRTPLEVIQSDRNEAEVERILDCIDYGMLA